MLFPTFAAGRLHLDTLWNTASAETSEREIYCRTPCVRSSRRPSLPQVSRSYDLPPPMPQLAHSRCLQNRSPSRAGAVPGTHASLVPSNADHRAPAYRLASCRPFLLFWPCQARLPASFHAIAGSIDWNNLSIIKEPVEQCSGKNLISKKAAPFGKTGVGGEQDRAMLIARGHQLKEMMSLFGSQFAVPDLIDDQHAGRGVASQPLPHQTWIGRTF